LQYPIQIFIKIFSNTFGDKRKSHIFATLFRGKATKKKQNKGV
jgi:hypothetical protein